MRMRWRMMMMMMVIKIKMATRMNHLLFSLSQSRNDFGHFWSWLKCSLWLCRAIMQLFNVGLKSQTSAASTFQSPPRHFKVSHITSHYHHFTYCLTCWQRALALFGFSSSTLHFTFKETFPWLFHSPSSSSSVARFHFRLRSSEEFGVNDISRPVFETCAHK